MQELILGTSRWGIEVDKKTAQEIFKIYIGACLANEKFPMLDSASNYPINKNKGDFMLANRWINEFSCELNGDQLGVINKIGSLDNSGAAINDLSPSYLQLQLQESQSLLGDKLKGIGIHWDNRNIERAVRATLDWLSSTSENYKLDPWLSGIKNLGLYSMIAKETNLKLKIQVKETAHDKSQRSEYLKHSAFLEQKFYVYGINGGGRRNHHEGQSQQKENSKNMMHFINNREISGLIIGPRTTGQLESSLDLWFATIEK